MAYWEVTRVEIQEIIRRWQAGEGYRQIASGTGVSRNTVRKYLSAAKAEGIARDGPAPTDDQLSRLAAMGQSGPRQAETPTEELLARWADQIYRWITGDRLQVTRIHELLLARGCPVTCQSVRRFIERRQWQRPRRSTVRMEETPPGEVAEMDFGRLALIHDPETGRRRALWALILVLGYSRHSFLWPIFNQKLEDVIAGLESAWAYFGGIPRYLVIGTWSSTASLPRWPRQTPCIPSSPGASWNTPSAGASLPMRPGSVIPRTSPKWNGASPTPGNASSREASSTREASSRTWPTYGCRPSGGAPRWRDCGRDCGSTAPPSGSPWWSSRTRSASPCSRGTASSTRSPTGAMPWRNALAQCQGHQHHHIQCLQALYSVPSSRCPPGQKLEARVDSKLVRIYHRGQLIKTHLRQPRGGRATDTQDYPAEIPRRNYPAELSAYTTRAPDGIKAKATELAPAVAEFAERLFNGPLPWAKVRQGHKLLRLGERYTPLRLDAACRRAL